MLTKSVVIAELDKQLLTKLSYLRTNLQQAIVSRNSDTKSSAGDKFETSREMAQIEIHKIETEISTKEVVERKELRGSRKASK